MRPWGGSNWICLFCRAAVLDAARVKRGVKTPAEPNHGFGAERGIDVDRRHLPLVASPVTVRPIRDSPRPRSPGRCDCWIRFSGVLISTVYRGVGVAVFAEKYEPYDIPEGGAGANQRSAL